MAKPSDSDSDVSEFDSRARYAPIGKQAKPSARGAGVCEFDSRSEYARVRQQAERPSSKGGGWEFESPAGYVSGNGGPALGCRHLNGRSLSS